MQFCFGAASHVTRADPAGPEGKPEAGERRPALPRSLCWREFRCQRRPVSSLRFWPRQSPSVTSQWRTGSACTSFITCLDAGMALLYISTMTSCSSVTLRPSLPLYIDGNHCWDSLACCFEVVAEQSCGVLTRLKNTPAWNPQHHAGVRRSINASPRLSTSVGARC